LADGPEELSADLLVVGGGLAGAAAALEALAAGASVVLASAGSGASERAQGGIAVASAEDDSPLLHAQDTLAAGAQICDPTAVESLVGGSGDAMRWLQDQGVEFDRRDGRLELGLEAAHSRSRIVHSGGDRTGAMIMHALERRLARTRGSLRRIEGRLEGLKVSSGAVVGALFSGAHGRPCRVRSGATLLATGGYAGLFGRTTTTAVCDGSALLCALAAGATLADLEFVQFHPTVWAGSGPGFLVTEALRGAGAELVDAGGRRFLFDFDPRGELAPRSLVARAVAEHLQKTGQPVVFLDARTVGGQALQDRFPGFLARCRARGLDPVRDLVPVSPAAHYAMGGLVTDLAGRSGVPGLLAAGECARTGLHGANRLASNSLLEAVVVGRRAGRAALIDARHGAGQSRGVEMPGSALQAAGQRWDGAGLQVRQVGQALADHAGPLRDAAGLDSGAEFLAAGAGSTPRAESARQFAVLIVRAARVREETRGAHVRLDHPAATPHWGASQVQFTGWPALIEVASRGLPGRP